MRKIARLILAILVLTGFSFAGKWLYLGPINEPLPVLKNYKIIDELEEAGFKISPFSPVENGSVEVFPGVRLKWRVTDGELVPSSGRSIYMFAVYTGIDKWGEYKINLAVNHSFSVYMDGKLLGRSSSGKLEKKKLLEPGKHSLMLKVIYEPDKSKNIRISLDMPGVKFSLDPQRPLGLREIMNLRTVSRISVSPCGKFAAITVSKWTNEGKRLSWIEIVNLKNRKKIRSFKDHRINQFRWRPHSSQFSYVTRDKEKATLWLSDIAGDTLKLVTEKNFGGYFWSKDGKFIVYHREKREKEFDDYGLKRVKNPPDRQRGSRVKFALYQLFPETGFVRPIAETENYPVSISPDGKTILLSKDVFDNSVRPYSFQEFWLLDINTVKLKKLLRDPWINYGIWSPDGKKMLFLGGPSAFNGAGNVLPRGRIPNEYDTQAYIYNFETGKVKPITRNFYPSIAEVEWAPDGKIYFTAEDKTFVRLYVYNPETDKITVLPSGVEVVRNISVSESGAIGFIGTGVNFPHRAYVLMPGEKEPSFVYFPEEKEFSGIRWGKVESWDVKLGKTLLKGRIYYPHGFSPSKKYPVILYYYGGTSPVSRDFAGRYPKEWWASKGYVVYVVVPAGSTGFGQEFSSYHVNDWGKVAGKQIIEASRKFIKSHSFVSKVGIIGASFGGFMTQYLLTKTDMYACGVSHAGISLLPHYWGEGYWGYSYNAVSTAFSFPWNRKDIYVNQSPLFFADKIKTPLLLLHGTDDTNVPPGESDQMFTALKLLGKPVEMVKVKGENHWVMGYKHRIGWYKTIIAWFDRWLKGDSTLWNLMFEKK